MSLPTLGIVYDLGAPPIDLATAFADTASLVFVTMDSEHTRAVHETLTEIGRVIPFESEEETARVLSDIDLSGIVTFSETALRTTAALASSLGLRGNSLEVSIALTDKARQRQLLHAAGVDALSFRVLNNVDELLEVSSTLDFPVVVKPTVGGGSRGVTLLRSREDVANYAAGTSLTDAVPIQVEEYLEGRSNDPFGDMVSVETATFDGETRLINVTGKFRQIPPFIEVGHVWPAQCSEEELLSVVELTLSALDALGFSSGIAHTEFKLTPAGPRLIEVNGRLGGFINVMCASDPQADLYRVAGLIAMGLDPTPSIPTEFAPFTSVFFQQPPADANRLLRADATPRARRLAKRYGLAKTPPVTFRRDFGADWLDFVVSTAPDVETLFGRLRDHIAETRFEFEFEGGVTAWVDGSELPSAGSLPLLDAPGQQGGAVT